MDTVVARLHRSLVEAMRRSRPDALSRPITVAEVYQDLVPYRSVRAALGIDMNADYEHALLRLLAGEGGYARLEPPEARKELRQELQSPNPNVGLFRKFAACDVWVNIEGTEAGNGGEQAGRDASARVAAGGKPGGAKGGLTDKIGDPWDILEAWGNSQERAGQTPPPGQRAPARPAARAPQTPPPPAEGLDILDAWAQEQIESTDRPAAAPRKEPPAPRPPARAAAGPTGEDWDILQAWGTGEESGPTTPAPAAPKTPPAARATPAPAPGPPQPAAKPPAPPARPPAPAAPRSPAARPAGTRPPGPQAAGSGCPACGLALPPGRKVRFCPNCGYDQLKRPCPSCGEVLEPGWRFCIACGSSVADE